MVGLSKCPSDQPYLLLMTGADMEHGVISHVLFSLCQRHAFAIQRCRVGILRWRRGHHIHVPPANAPLTDLEQWLRGKEDCINISKSQAMLCGEPVHWVDTPII